MRLMIESFILDSFEATQEHFDAMEMCLDQCNTNEISRNELKKANEDHTKVVADLRDELSEVAKLVYELQDQIETERYVIGLLTEEKDELDIQLKNEKKRFSDTQSLVSDLKNEIKELANLVENPQEENLNEELNEKLKEKEKQIEEMRKELEDIKNVHVADRRIDEEKYTKKVISDLRFELSEMVELLEEVKQREKETSTQIAQKESERELLIIQLRKKIEDLNAQLIHENIKEKKTDTSNGQQDMLKKIGHLQTELQEKKNLIETLQNNTSNDQPGMLKKIDELQTELQERDKLIKTLQSKDNVGLLNRIDFLQIELLGKDRRIKCLQNSNDGKEVDLKKALKTKSELELEVGDLQRMMKAKEKGFTEALHNHSLDLIGVKSQVNYESLVVKFS
jgi:chromosome segregation ATPase